MSGGPFIFMQSAAGDGGFPTPDFTMWNSDEDLQGYLFDGTDITLLGNASPATTMDTADRGSPTHLSDYEVAIAGSDFTNKRELIKFQFNGTDWTQVGNTFTPGNGFTSTAMLGPNRIAATYSQAGLETYDFDGTDWAQVGNQSSAGTGTKMVSVSAVTTVSFNTAFNRLDSVSFDGTDWTTDGKLTNMGFEVGGLCALDATHVAVFDRQNGFLYTYEIGPSNFFQIGNGLAIAGQGNFAMGLIAEGRVAAGRTNTGDIQCYDWDGTDWVAVGNTLGSQLVPDFNCVTGAYLFI